MVVVEGNTEVAGVLGSVAVGVADEGSLPLSSNSSANYYSSHGVGIQTWS